MTSQRATIVVLMLGVVTCGAGCGINCSFFLTPVYRRPSGYSDTFRRRLDAEDTQPPRKVLLDPSLTDLPDPVPLPPVRDDGVDSGDNGRSTPGGSTPQNGLPLPPVPALPPGSNGSSTRSDGRGPVPPLPAK